MRRPRLSKKVLDGLSIIAMLAESDMDTDPCRKKEFKNGYIALEYIIKLQQWYNQKKGAKDDGN